MRDSYIHLSLGMVGVLAGLIPFAYINGVPVSLIDARIDSVYYDVLEKGRAAYIPLLFISIIMVMTSIYEIVSRTRLPLEMKLLAVTSYSFSTLAVSLVLSYLSLVESISTPIRGGVLTVYLSIRKTLIYSLFSYRGFAPLFLLSVATSVYYFVDAVLSARFSSALKVLRRRGR